MDVDTGLDTRALLPAIGRLWDLSAEKIRSVERTCPPQALSPVFTAGGRYTARGWTEWTRGFQYGSALLQFEATGDASFLDLGRDRTLEVMPAHLTHTGVHDHGFTTVSTYGTLRRLAIEGRFRPEGHELAHYELALRVSGAVQAARWTATADGLGFVHSFNGPHSLFVDTLRSCRALTLAHLLGQVLLGERDRRISLLDRAIDHALTTARWNVYQGRGRDAYDVRGRTAHESIFNVADGSYRCPSSQQGYSPFSTWTRGLAWAMLGFAELLELLAVLPDTEFEGRGGRAAVTGPLIEAATAACDHYLDITPTDGIPYWDTGAPGLHRLGDYLNRPAEPDNPEEPVDSSAAAIAAQGLLRLGHHLGAEGPGSRYRAAGLTVARRLFEEPYLNTDPEHQGLILHSVYHRPNGWDAVPPGARVPQGESSMWGDYHARELALHLQRLATGHDYLTFFAPLPGTSTQPAGDRS